MRIHIYNHSYHEVISGGDAISAEFARTWKDKNHSVLVCTNLDAEEFFLSRGITPSSLRIAKLLHWKSRSVLVASAVHLFNGVVQALIHQAPAPDVIFATSWMPQDIVPAWIDKIKHPHAHFVVGCYIFLQHPKHRAYGSNRINRWAFWIMYNIGLFIMSQFANTIWTASPQDAVYVTKHFHLPAYPIRGGVDLGLVNKTSKHSAITTDAIFLGRFHPQKNIPELLSIWKQVLEKRADSTLTIVGDGFEKQTIEDEIKRLKLEAHVIVLPQIDGEEKYALLRSARIFTSASHLDTGNLAMDEALACGIPGIVYDVPQMVYPKGVVLIPRFEKEKFVQAIVSLLTDKMKYKTLSAQAYAFGQTLSWDTQALSALQTLTKRIKKV